MLVFLFVFGLFIGTLCGMFMGFIIDDEIIELIKNLKRKRKK